ncbi:MAG TPA: sigma-70 family RNA polymerase sigma factor [Solirubrobacteraceae bacterium]|jgi:RNA polymerase sigma factor (sigma-70 family)|nr:sigma-70 family RNA polymerase sigma factor [Solirubrobacteraceae bacterium]
MTSPVAFEAGEGCLGTLDEVAELFAEQASRVRRLVRAGVRAPEPLVEDACQLAWVRLFQHRARVRRDTATAWLVRTAIREALKQMHRVGRELSLEALAETAGEDPPSAPALLDDLIDHRARLEAIRILPERQQRLVWLQGLGLTYTEMAGQTGTTRRTVERQLLRAKRTLAGQEA